MERGCVEGTNEDKGTHSTLIGGDRLDGARVDNAQEQHGQVE